MFLSLPLPIKKSRNISVRLVAGDPDTSVKQVSFPITVVPTKYIILSHSTSWDYRREVAYWI